MARHRFPLASCAPVLVLSILATAPANAWGQPPGTAQEEARLVGTIHDIRPIRDQVAVIVSRLELLLEGEGQTCDSRAFREALREFERLAERAQRLVDREAAYRARTGAAPRPIDLEAERANAAIQERLERWRARLAECVRRARPAATTGRGSRQGRFPPGPDFSLPGPDTVPRELARRFFRLNVEFLDAGLSCNLAEMRAMLARLEQLAAEFSRASEAAREAGSAGTAEARNLANVDAIVQRSIEFARQQLRACEERSAASTQPPAEEDEDPEYPDDDAPPASAARPASPPAAVTPRERPSASDDRPIDYDLERSTPSESRVTQVPGVAGTQNVIAGELQRRPQAAADTPTGPARPDAAGSSGFIIVVPGYGEFVVPATGIGVMRAGPPGIAPELFGAETPRSIPQVGARAGYATGSGGFNLEAYYFEGSETRPFNVPSAAGTDTGRVNGALSPGGSSGIIGPFSLDGEVRTEGVTFGARASLEVLETSDAVVSPGTAFGLRVFSYAQRSETTYSGLVNGRAVIGGTTFGFTQERDQEVDETRLGVGAEGLLEVRIGGGVGFAITASGSVYYRSTDLDSVERNTCTFCPVADRDFTVPIRDEDNGFGVHGGLRTGIDFSLSPRISFTVGGQIDYWSRVGALFNPNSGDQVFFDGLRTGLRITDAWSWSVGAGLIIRIGSR